MFSIKELESMTKEQKEKIFGSHEKCSICGEKIRGQYFIDKKSVCEDCYWSEFDKVLTDHPIWHPRLLKG